MQRLQFLTDASTIKRSAVRTSIVKNGERARVAKGIATLLLASGCRNFSARLGNSLCLFFREKKRAPPAWLTRSTLRCWVSRDDERLLRYRVTRSALLSTGPLVSSPKQSPNSRLSMRRRYIVATKTYRLRSCDVLRQLAIENLE